MIFGLVHGGAHSPWSWTYLVPELRERGHDSIAVDLPIDDPQAGRPEYVEAAVESLGAAEPLVVVGHSMGASAALEAAERLRPKGLVLLCPAIVFGSSPGAPETMLTMSAESMPWPTTG